MKQGTKFKHRRSIDTVYISTKLISILKPGWLKKQAYTKHIFQPQNIFN